MPDININMVFITQLNILKRSHLTAKIIQTKKKIGHCLNINIMLAYLDNVEDDYTYSFSAPVITNHKL